MFMVIWETNNIYLYCNVWDKATSRFTVICEPNNMFMVILDPNDLYICLPNNLQGNQTWNLHVIPPDKSLHCYIVHVAKQFTSLIMCDPNTLHVCCDLGANQLLCYCYFGAKQLLFLWLFGRQTISICIVMCGIKTTSRFTVICEPNNIYFYGYLGAKRPQFGSQTTFKGATSGTFLCFLQTNLFIVTWFMEPISVCFEDYV